MESGRGKTAAGVDRSPGNIWGWVAALALLVSIVFSWRLLSDRLLARAGDGGIGTPGLFAEISRRPYFSFGFRNFLADVIWLKAIQVSGKMKMAQEDYDRLYELVNVVANFDPKFEIPYLLGGLTLGDSPLHGQKAVRFLERGKAAFSADWRFPFYIGYMYYYVLGDAEAGGGAMGEAAKLPGSPVYLAGLASRMLSEAREPETALALLGTIAQQEGDPTRRALLERKIREVTVERDLQVLERGVERYRQRTGEFPPSLENLVREGILAALPKEPNGGRYMLEAGGTVRSDRVEQRLRVFRPR